MTEAAQGTPARSFSDSYITENPQRSLEELTKALEDKSDDAAYYCQRAYAHILLQNYKDAVLDAKRSLELQPNNANAFLRKGEAEFHLKNYSSAEDTFKQGQTLNCSSSCELSTNQQKTSKYRHDWYQTESHVIITVMIKNVQKEEVHIQFAERQLTVNLKLPSEETYSLMLFLFHYIVPAQSTFKVLSTKIEIKMKKTEVMRWDKLEGHADQEIKHVTPESMHKYPSSSHYTKNWDKIVVQIKEEEKNEKMEGDAALNSLFQQIYSDGNDEVKRAMNKSFEICTSYDAELRMGCRLAVWKLISQLARNLWCSIRDKIADIVDILNDEVSNTEKMESGGTVLSTNWTDVSKRKVDVNPPDDMEWKKF